MLLLMVLVYAALLWLLFGMLRLPAGRWTVTAAILIGIVGIGAVSLAMNYYHPYSSEARFATSDTPLRAAIRGKVVSVSVRNNMRVAEGDELYRIDPAAVLSQIAELEQRLRRAEAELANARVLQRRGGDWQAAVQGAQSDVDTLTAQLAEAQGVLAQTVVRAPAAGTIVAVRVHEGMQVEPADPAPLMRLAGSGTQQFVAAFKQNPLQSIKAGADVEIAFAAIPGKVFKGRVKGILNEESQPPLAKAQTGIAKFIDGGQGRVPVQVEILDDLSSYQLTRGVRGEVAVYSTQWRPMALVRRVLLRMRSWSNYAVVGG
ncbi:MAG: efflux RND transporter periplasmic adaptor subunit [Pseudomonadota bacterium]|nr:MAG: efflux RND transporter periplasmic adaptor subunit [Pseudomonadota bacterium]